MNERRGREGRRKTGRGARKGGREGRGGEEVGERKERKCEEINLWMTQAGRDGGGDKEVEREREKENEGKKRLLLRLFYSFLLSFPPFFSLLHPFLHPLLIPRVISFPFLIFLSPLFLVSLFLLFLSSFPIHLSLFISPYFLPLPLLPLLPVPNPPPLISLFLFSHLPLFQLSSLHPSSLLILSLFTTSSSIPLQAVF